MESKEIPVASNEDSRLRQEWMDVGSGGEKASLRGYGFEAERIANGLVRVRPTYEMLRGRERPKGGSRPLHPKAVPYSLLSAKGQQTVYIRTTQMPI